MTKMNSVAVRVPPAKPKLIMAVTLSSHLHPCSCFSLAVEKIMGGWGLRLGG